VSKLKQLFPNTHAKNTFNKRKRFASSLKNPSILLTGKQKVADRNKEKVHSSYQTSYLSQLQVSLYSQLQAGKREKK